MGHPVLTGPERPEPRYRQDDHHDRGRPGDHVEQARVHILAHQFLFVDQQQQLFAFSIVRCHHQMVSSCLMFSFLKLLF